MRRGGGGTRCTPRVESQMIACGLWPSAAGTNTIIACSEYQQSSPAPFTGSGIVWTVDRPVGSPLRLRTTALSPSSSRPSRLISSASCVEPSPNEALQISSPSARFSSADECSAPPDSFTARSSPGRSESAVQIHPNWSTDGGTNACPVSASLRWRRPSVDPTSRVRRSRVSAAAVEDRGDPTGAMTRSLAKAGTRDSVLYPSPLSRTAITAARGRVPAPPGPQRGPGRTSADPPPESCGSGRGMRS